jgi:hypothetical protein
MGSIEEIKDMLETIVFLLFVNCIVNVINIIGLL